VSTAGIIGVEMDGALKAHKTNHHQSNLEYFPTGFKNSVSLNVTRKSLKSDVKRFNYF
jgi:hypothetical protein